MWRRERRVKYLQKRDVLWHWEAWPQAIKEGL